MHATLTTGPAIFFTAMATASRPRQRLTVSQWADAHRVLSPKASSEPGPWKTARVPYVREIMDCLSITSPVQSVTLMKASQVAGTEIGLNWIGYVMQHAPAPMLVVVPTLDVRGRWVIQRLDPMINDARALADLFDTRRKRDAKNTEAIKDYPGGMLVIGGANSPASLSSMPIKYVLNDEVDRFPWEAGGEGDPLGLIRTRQQTFPRRKEFNVSSPTIKDASRIEEMFLAGDQRYYHVPCPHCGELQILVWENLLWTVNPITKEPKSAIYVCMHCGAEIEEHHKTDILRELGHGGLARWVPKRPGVAARSYHIHGLYAPLGLGLRWVELARGWLVSQADRTKLKVFINTKFGEPWEDRSHAIQPNMLMERNEGYGLREIPPGCFILTCGIDVQGDRLAIQVLGWGRGETCWTIDWLEMPGDPTRLLEEAAKGEGPVVEYLKKPFANRYGREILIEATAIDTGGHHTHQVYNFVRSRQVRRLMAIKGSNIPSKPILAGRPQPQDVNWKGKTIKGGVLLWMIGTDTAKHALFARLTGDANVETPARKIHFSTGLPVDYYEQLTAEAFDPEHNKWVKRRGRRNEALDTWVYAAAAAQHPEIRVHTLRARDWARLERLLEPPDAMPMEGGTVVEALPASAESAPETPPPAGKKAKPPRRPAESFVNRWKR